MMVCDADLSPVSVNFIQHVAQSKEKNGTQGAKSDGKGKKFPTLNHAAGYKLTTGDNSVCDKSIGTK